MQNLLSVYCPPENMPCGNISGYTWPPRQYFGERMAVPLAQPQFGLMNMESYDQFMPSWIAEAQQKMKTAEEEGKKAAQAGDGSSTVTSSSSSSSSSSLMNLYKTSVNTANGDITYTGIDARELMWPLEITPVGHKAFLKDVTTVENNQIQHVDSEEVADGGKKVIMPGRIIALVNLADAHLDNFQTFGKVDFVAGGGGKHTINNMQAGETSHVTFSI